MAKALNDFTDYVTAHPRATHYELLAALYEHCDDEQQAASYRQQALLLRDQSPLTVISENTPVILPDENILNILTSTEESAKPLVPTVSVDILLQRGLFSPINTHDFLKKAEAYYDELQQDNQEQLSLLRDELKALLFEYQQNLNAVTSLQRQVIRNKIEEIEQFWDPLHKGTEMSV